MNKLLQKVAKLFLGLSLAAGVGVAVGSNRKEASRVHAAADTYVTMGSGSGSNNVNTWYIDSNKVTVTQNKGSGTTNPNASYVSGTNTRFYVGNVMAFVAATGYKVTGVKFTNSTSSSYYGGTYYANTSWTNSSSNITTDDTTNLTLTNCATTTSGSTSTIESKSASGVSAIYIGTTKQSRPSKIEVKYTSSTTSYTTTVNVTGGALSVNNTSTSFTSAVTYGFVYLTPDSEHVIPDNPASAFSVSNATLSSAYDNQDGDVALYLTSVSGNITVSGAFDEKQGTYYSVSYTGSNGSLSSTSDVAEGDPLDVYLQPATHYHLPTSITLTMGGVTQTAGTDYDYDNVTGEIQILEVTGNIVISTSCVEDAKYTVTYVKGDHGTGSDYVVSNQYAGSYTLVTFATAGFTAVDGYSLSKWNVGGVEYAEGASITISGNTTVTATYVSITNYTKFTGNLVEGDYIIVDETDGKAMKNAVTSSPRIDVVAVTPVNNVIATNDTSIVWHIAKDGDTDNWTIYNAAVEKYAAFNSTNGRGTLIASVTDYARWTTSGSYEFINVGKTSNNYLRHNNTYGFASYTTSTGHTLSLYKAPSNELSSIALSGDYKTSFASGDTFSFGGTVSASYTLNDPANVTSGTTFHLDSAEGTSMSGVTMTHAAHDGHTIYAKYTEGGITKTATYEISVSNAPVSSVSITTHAAEIGLEEDYSISGITPTVLPADAVQTTEWVVASNTVSNDYTWNGTKLTSGNTEGTVTLRCRSTADNSKYDEIVVTISGDPVAEFAKDSTSGYASKSETISFTYGNFDAEDIAITSGNTSYVTIGTVSADHGSGSVVINFVAAGSTSVTIGDGNSTLDTLTVTVNADNVASVSWSATDIDVFSGETLSTTGWNVQYHMDSGDTGSAVSYTIKLGSATVTAGYEFKAEDNNKTMHVEYGGVSSSSITVTVTQSIHNVNAPTMESNTVSWTATAAANLGSAISSEGGTDSGTISTGDYSWNYTRTLTSLASNKSDNISWQGTTWIQLGSNNSMESIEFTTSSIPGTITSVSVVVATAGSHELTIDVGGTKYLENESLYLYSGTAAADNPDPSDCVETGTGTSSGAITITIAPTAATKKAMVIRSISVTYETATGTPANIANNASHKAAQRAAVAFAQAFNAAMDETENCTTGLDAAWSTCSSAYTSFKNAAAALGSTEEAYALNLVKYATAQYSDDSAEACIERMMKTYEICVQKHGKTAFMDDLVTLDSAHVSPLINIVGEKTNSVAIIVIISMVSVTAIGGYFFLRKRKENI